LLGLIMFGRKRAGKTAAKTTVKQQLQPLQTLHGEVLAPPAAGGGIAARTAAPPAAPSRPAKVTVKVKKYGFLGALLRPIGSALALLILGWGVLSIGTTYYRSYQRHLEYSKLTHTDESYLQVLLGQAGPALSTGETKFVYKDIDGKIHRVVAARSAVDRFVNATLVALDNERDDIMKAADRDLRRSFDTAFSDRKQVIEKYADWFFEWKRSYVILKESITSTASRLMETGKYESLKEAVEHDINDYFMKHYLSQVLKPESRDEVINREVDKVVRRAHRRFRRAIAHSDDRLQTFLAENTRVLEEAPAGQKVANIHLDWDARKWKAPRYDAGDMAFDGLKGVGAITAGGALGALTPVLARAVGSAFSGLAQSIVSSMGGRIVMAEGGAAVGTVGGPGIGTAIGTGVGLALGAGVDYIMAKRREKQNRKAFVEANQKALDLTIEQWRGRFRGSVDGAVRRWFEDARAGTILSRKRRPSPAAKRPMGGRTNTPTS